MRLRPAACVGRDSDLILSRPILVSDNSNSLWNRSLPIDWDQLSREGEANLPSDGSPWIRRNAAAYLSPSNRGPRVDATLPGRRPRTGHRHVELRPHEQPLGGEARAQGDRLGGVQGLSNRITYHIRGRLAVGKAVPGRVLPEAMKLAIAGYALKQTVQNPFQYVLQSQGGPPNLGPNTRWVVSRKPPPGSSPRSITARPTHQPRS